MRDLVSSIKATLPAKVAMAALPATIGILPMPGGALFSAPLVDDCDETGTVPPELKTKVNYWFRHIWEYWWPLYPGVLLAIDISGVSPGRFILLQLPMTFAAVAVGWFFLVRKIPPPCHDNDEQARKQSGKTRQITGIFRAVAPIAVVAITYTAIRIYVPAVSALNKYAPIVLGILAGMAFTHLKRPMTWARWRNIVCSKRVAKLIVLVAAVRIYGAVVESKLPSGILLVEKARLEMSGWPAPTLVAIALIPFVSGLSTGLAIGFVGASLPIVMSFVGGGSFANVAPALALAYACGYAGMLLSPIHVCLIVTNEHFKTNMARSILTLAPPVATLLALTTAYYAILKAIL